MEDRASLPRYAEHVVVAVDVRGGHAMLSGWQEEGPPIDDLVPALADAGAPRLLVTSIAESSPNPSSATLPASAPAISATTHSAEFQAIVAN